MPTLWQMNDPSCVLTVLFWVAAVWALGHILFGSYFANLLDQWIRRRFNYDHQIYRLSWELFHKCEWEREYASAQNKDLVKRPRDLTTAEISERKRKYWALYFTMWHVRMVRYFLGCPFCHHFWAAMMLTLSCSSTRGVGQTIVNAVAYCGITTISISRLLQINLSGEPEQASRPGCPGGNCMSGKQRAAPRGGQ